jgi:O-acetyl-ADP-ribose deacetylase
MHTTPGSRKSAGPFVQALANTHRRFFPSTEPETTEDSEWEQVEGGESAENGPAEKEDMEQEKGGDVETKVELPDVPTADPADEGPSTKKQKPNDDEEL